MLPKLILLRHLDLSCNGFTYEESFAISKALEQNHTLLGFHFSGNWGYTDEKMFLIVTKDKYSEQSFGKEQLIRQIDSVNCVKRKQKSKPKWDMMKSKCWICEGWVERTFTWFPETSGTIKINQITNPLFIHFENEGWKPILLQPTKYIIKQEIPTKPRVEYKEGWDKVKECFIREKIIHPTEDEYQLIKIKKVKYEITRMLPPGKIRYVFSSLKHTLQAADLDKKIEFLNIPLKIVPRFHNTY